MADSYAAWDSASNLKKLKVNKQYYAGFIVNLGALAIGMLIGWSSPAEKKLVKQIKVEQNQYSWISSLMTLGAASSQVFVAILLNRFSRKHLIITMAVGLIAAWLLIACANDVTLYYAGRYFTGFFAGSFCTTVPIYVAEIAHKSVRGTLGILFQIMLVFGILLVYSIGELKSRHWINVASMLPPVALILPLWFLPVSPVYYLNKGKQQQARESLRYYRGKTYDIESEIAEIIAYSSAMHDVSVLQNLKERASYRAILILVTLHIVQQCSGIFAFMFYADDIFEKAGSSVSPGVSAIILALLQLVFTAIAAVLVDKLGRRLLWIISLTILTCSNFAMGIYFLVDYKNHNLVESVGFLPVCILSFYIIGYSLGCGPLPWSMLGEMVPNRIKFMVNTGVSSLNWLVAFIVTFTFKKLRSWIGDFAVFFLYGFICALGMLFVFFFVVETKNKTLEEIQSSLSKRRMRTQSATIVT